MVARSVSWSSIPLNAGAEVLVDLPIGGRAQVMGSSGEMPPSADPRDVTQAYVEAGIARYEREGLDATVAYYNSPESIEGERSMMILQAGDQTVLASVLYPGMIGTNTFSSPNTPLGSLMAQATEEGYWFENFSFNPATQQQEPSLFLAILHDNLIFVSVHSLAREDVAAVTQDYVNRAIEMYNREGLEATIAYYDSRESVDGQFYLFLIDEKRSLPRPSNFSTPERYGHQGCGGFGRSRIGQGNRRGDGRRALGRLFVAESRDWP